MNDGALREQIARFLSWEDAHTGFEKVFEGVPEELRGVRPPSHPHSLWELLEHLRLTQRDILEFCIDPGYQEREWPADYWPAETAPPDARSWEVSVREFLQDRDELIHLAGDPRVDLFAAVPQGTGQTYLRELLLVADHNSHHLGQAILVRRALGAWE
jgi:uncharacterized damage-inducible protein DinB